MCPGVDSASKNKHQDSLGGKNGRCVRVTTLSLSECRKSRKSGAITYRNPLGHLGLWRDTFTFTLYTFSIFAYWTYATLKLFPGVETPKEYPHSCICQCFEHTPSNENVFWHYANNFKKLFYNSRTNHNEWLRVVRRTATTPIIRIETSVRYSLWQSSYSSTQSSYTATTTIWLITGAYVVTCGLTASSLLPSDIASWSPSHVHPQTKKHLSATKVLRTETLHDCRGIHSSGKR
jgi:hypothetical protein